MTKYPICMKKTRKSHHLILHQIPHSLELLHEVLELMLLWSTDVCQADHVSWILSSRCVLVSSRNLSTADMPIFMINSPSIYDEDNISSISCYCFDSFIHMYIHCLGHFSSLLPNLSLSPQTPLLPGKIASPILFKRRHKQ
jgi:hypothetical protein